MKIINHGSTAHVVLDTDVVCKHVAVGCVAPRFFIAESDFGAEIQYCCDDCYNAAVSEPEATKVKCHDCKKMVYLDESERHQLTRLFSILGTKHYDVCHHCVTKAAHRKRLERAEERSTLSVSFA